MPDQTVIVYPSFTAQLGGAQYARIGVRVAHVTLSDGRTVKMPAAMALAAAADGGITLALCAEAWARRQAGERCAIHGFIDDGPLTKPCPGCSTTAPATR